MINIAKNWIGTPFVVGGYTKYGCDCIGLIIGILNECCIDIKPYEYLEFGNYNHLDLDKILDIMQVSRLNRSKAIFLLCDVQERFLPKGYGA